MPQRDRGQSFLEYGLIILLIVLVVVGALTLIGPALAHIFSQIPGDL